MSRKWRAVGGLVVVVAAALVGGQLLLSRTPGSSNAARTTPGTPGSVGVSLSSETSSSNPTTATAAARARKDADVNGDLAKANLVPFPPMPASKLPPIKLTAPARTGEALAPLADAPGATVSALKLGAVPKGAAYSIRMRPYGYGPSSQLGSRIVIRVDSAKSVNGSPERASLARANVIALVDTARGGRVAVGGAYTARLTFGSDGHKLYPVLSAVVPVR